MPDRPVGRNEGIGYTHAAVAGGLCRTAVALYVFGRRGWGGPVASLVLLALHPAWRISVSAGDCGGLRRDASHIVTGIGAAVPLAYSVYATWAAVWRLQREEAGDYGEGPGGALR